MQMACCLAITGDTHKEQGDLITYKIRRETHTDSKVTHKLPKGSMWDTQTNG
jgi:hypothetical protein